MEYIDLATDVLAVEMNTNAMAKALGYKQVGETRVKEIAVRVGGSTVFHCEVGPGKERSAIFLEYEIRMGHEHGMRAGMVHIPIDADFQDRLRRVMGVTVCEQALSEWKHRHEFVRAVLGIDDPDTHIYIAVRLSD